MKHIQITILFVMLVGCANTPSHLPNPLVLPFQAVSTGAENARYNARRAVMAESVRAHHQMILEDIKAGGGPRLEAAMQLASIPAKDRSTVTKRLSEDVALYAQDPEALVVALMVHGP